MKSVYLKSLGGFLLMFFVILAVLIRNEPRIVQVKSKDQFTMPLPSDTRIVLYALLYACLGTFTLYVIEKGKYVTNVRK